MPIELTLVQKVAVWALPLLFAITVPEMVRGYIARALGDNTAQMLGRLSPNPLRYVDPLGTVLVPGLLIALGGGFLMGWPKALPVDIRNFKKPLRDIALSSAAVPATMALLAVLWAVLLKSAMLAESGDGMALGLRMASLAGIQISVVLMALNLLPLPPLAGGHILLALLPRHLAYQYARVENYAFIILVLLMVSGALGKILFWPVSLMEGLLFSLFGIAPGDFLL